MKYSDDLYQLIRSLSKSEKRYFRLFAARYSGQKKYMRLFQAIDRQESYDEEAIREAFEGDAVANQFHVAKNYLYKLVLRSLRSFYAESSSIIRMREMITDIEILYERGLFRQARKLWRQAKKLIDRTEDPELTLAIVRLRQQLSGKDSDKLESLDALQAERRSALREIEMLSEYEYLGEKLGNICTGHPSRGTAEFALLDHVMQSPLLLGEEPIDSSFRVRQSYLWAYATYHYGRHELEEALDYMRRLRRLYTANTERLRGQPSWYIGVVSNILILLNQLGRIEESMEELRQFQEAFRTFSSDRFVNTRATSLYFHCFYWNSLALRAEIGDFDYCLEISEEIERFLEEYPNYAVNGTYPSLILLLAYSRFAVGQHDKGLDYLAILLNRPEPIKGRSGYYAARTLEIMTHYELGNMDVLDSRLRSFRGYLESTGRLGAYERAALSFFEALLDADSDGRTKELFRELGEQFRDFSRRESTHHIFTDLDFTAWIESRISGRSFAETVRDRYRTESNLRSEIGRTPDEERAGQEIAIAKGTTTEQSPQICRTED